MEYISDPTKKLSLRFIIIFVFYLCFYWKFCNLRIYFCDGKGFILLGRMTNAMEVMFLEAIFVPADPIWLTESKNVSRLPRKGVLGSSSISGKKVNLI